MKVLIIDSSVQIVSRLEEMLLNAKAITLVCFCAHYGNGLQVYNETRPDVVVLGISLPETQSVKMLGEIKAVRFATPVIMLTTSMNGYILEQCRLLGADYFLDKYYDFEKIAGVINSIVSKK